MKTKIAIIPALMFAMTAWAQTAAPKSAPASGQTPVKVAIIHMQDAIVQTKDGQKAGQEMQTKFSSRRQELEKKQTDITALQNQMRAGSATMSEAAKAKLQRDYDTNTKDFTRARDDFQAEVTQEENKIMNDIGQKLMDVVIKYATEHAIAVVVDVSSQQTPVIWADPSIDITNDVIKLYDQAHPNSVPAPTPAPAAPTTKKQ